MTKRKFIPVYEPLLAGNEKKYLQECIDTNWISSQGKYIKEFESEFAKFHKLSHALSTSNGTTALHLALISLGIGKGDEVIVPLNLCSISKCHYLYARHSNAC
jgi:perosamine synthetase